MSNLSLTQFILGILLVSQVFTAPLPRDDFCSGDNLYKYEEGKEYSYDYETNTQLWINNVSDESKSSLKLKSTVTIRPLGACTYALRLQGTSLSGESLGDAAQAAAQLDAHQAVFRLNQQGELDPVVKFQPDDKPWSRNVKRGVISVFQAKSESHLRPISYFSDSEERSATVYETDVLGRCRTTYSLASGSSSQSVKLTKKKSLQRCTLNANSKTSSVQYVPYKTLPEFFQGRLFIESYECSSQIDSNLLSSVECKETSTYRIGSRGRLGAQAVVKQSLKFLQATSSSESAPQRDSYQSLSVLFEYDNSNQNEEDSELNINEFVQNICSKSLTAGLAGDHSDNFRSLVKSLRSRSASQLVQLYQESNSKCKLAGLTVAQAVLFADTESSSEAVLSLLDKDVFDEHKVITEYPLLTALARDQNPSRNQLNKLRDYISQKPDDFAYLNKLYLVYSAQIKTHCSQNECSTPDLASWTSVFSANLANACSDSQKRDLVPSSLKAIGNIGYYAQAEQLAKCATNRANSLEIRINAIESTRRFACEQVESLTHNYELLEDISEDAEVRISAFLALVRCSDSSARFNEFAKSKLSDFLMKENDVQVLTYVIDYGREHGLTSVLNTVLNEPQIREKFSVNFKELSWNNYKYRYNVMRDSALEVDTSVVYTSKTFIPRSVRVNATMHMFGMSINFLDMNLRLEGLDEILKAVIVDKLKSEKLLKRLMQKPEQLIELLNLVAEKLKYAAEKPLISLSLRIYGSDVYYSRLDSADELKRLAGLFKGPRENLYKQVETIRNLLLVNSVARQPLANGLEFENSFDLSAALLVNKASTKEQEEDELNFVLNNFYSSSFSINRKYNVLVNAKNKLSLKKHSVFNSRFRLDVDGTKKKGSATYNLNLTPGESVKLLSLEGKFYKLSSGGQYSEVKEFNVERTNYNGCTSDRFETAFGVNLCYAIERPKASLKEAFKYFQLEDVEQSAGEDDEDEEDEADTDSELTRPSLILSGPYSYQINLKNPNQIKTITFDAQHSAEDAKREFNALLKTKSHSGEEKETLKMIYSREKQVTNRGVQSNLNFQFVRPTTQEVRFLAQANFEYQKSEILAVNFVVDNKIGKQFNVVLNFGRNKTQSDAIVPNYYLDAVVDSQLRETKYYRLFGELKPNGKHIEASFYAQKGDTKLLTSQLELKANNEDNDAELDYAVDFKAESWRKGVLTVQGTVAASLLKSKIDLNLEYSNPSFSLPKPGRIRMGHLYDGAAGARSHLEFHLDAPMTPIDHGAKLLFTYNIESGKFEYVELLLSRPDRESPISIYFERGSKSTDLTFGLRNARLNLAELESELAKTLVRVDDQEVLRSFELNLVRDHDKVNKKINSELKLKKNEKIFVELKYNLKGNLEAIRKSTTEVAKQELGAEAYVRVLDNSGSISAELDFESSAKNNKHEFDFEFKTENLFKMLLRISSISSEFRSSGSQFNAKVEIQKVGDVKSLKLQSTSGLRSSGGSKEFDVSFEKKLASGQTLTGKGVAKYTFKDFKNFQTEVNVKDHYESKMSLETKRSNTEDLFGFHSFKFSNKHLSGVKSERDVSFLVHNKTEPQGNTLLVSGSLRRGDLGTLKNKEKLDVLIELNSENVVVKQANGERKLESTSNLVEFKSKRFNMDLYKTLKASHDSKTKMTRAEGVTKFKFPAIFTDPGKFKKLAHSYKYSRNTGNNEISFKNDFDTDSKLFGRYFKLLNIDFNRQVSKSVKSNLSLDYKLASEETLRTVRAQVEHDYVNFKVNLKQNRLTQLKSMFKPGLTIEVSDCTANGKYERKKTSSDYLLDFLLNLECQAKLLVRNKLFVSRAGRDTDAPKSKFELTASSDIYNLVKTIAFEHEKFTPESGLISYKLQDSKEVSFANEFSYKRVVNVKTNKLESAKYKLDSEVGTYFTKKCELNIDSKVDYYNSFNCRLNTTRVQNIELTYGYSLKVENPFDYLSGKRGIQLDVVVPGRALRATYKSNYATPIDGDDENDEREFNGTATLQWDFLKEPAKLITVNLKRDNYAKGKTLTYIDVVDHPKFNQLRFELDTSRSFDKTVINAAALYELKTGNKNRLDVTVRMNSDLDTNSFSLETNLQRPSVNTLYENRYNKNNGRLEYLSVRLGRLLKLSVDKESDPEERKISLQLVNPDESKFSFEGMSRSNGAKYVVEGSLSKSGARVSSLVSTFDADNNNFDVQIKGVANNYKFNFGMFNETLASAHILNENTNVVLGLASLQVVAHEEHNDLVLSAQWNRLWGDLQRDLLGEEAKAQVDEKYNSYLGDVYAELADDLKPSVDSLRKERQAVGSDFRNLFFIVLDTYAKYLPAHMRNEDKESELKQFVEMQMSQASNEDLPLYRRFFKAYNSLAERLLKANLKVREYSKSLSKFIPRLPMIEYNKPQLTKEVRPFANNLVVTRPTLYARNLYQFNAEYRDFIRKLGETVLSTKRSFTRSVEGISVRAVINKYKYRSLKDYTLVANVYNKRNIIGFDGEHRTLQSKCRYLLAHEMHKNRFSVVLNFNDNPYLISLFAYGQKSVDISFNKAGVGGKPVSLPHTVNLGENGVITVTKTNVAVCAELNHDVRVCCYEDSNSCTIALTRWYTGKLNGLLGQANNNPQDTLNESDWYLEKTCKFPNSQLKKPSLDAIKTCHAVFGKHRRSFFRHAIMAIRPSGWQRVCETVLTFDSKAKCVLMKAFDHHADEENVLIEAPDECFTCSASSKQYNIGQSVSKSESVIEKGSDYVFLTLPCDKSKYGVDLSNLVSSLKAKNPLNKYYVVSVDENDASIYQSDSNEIANFDVNKAYKALADDSTETVSKNNFNKGLFLAASLFSKRLAQNRFLIIRSCGNCLPYSALDTLKYSKKIASRNVIVHSWGDYDIKVLDDEDADFVPFGYDEENVFMYKPNEKSVESDTLDTYKIEHKADLCQRLAIKSHGSVINLKYLRESEVLSKVGEWLEEPVQKFEYKVKKCQKYDSSFGDLLDFSYTRTKIETDD